ncbi:Transposase and inactivated derivatives [Kocuria rosea]|nr:Transposase and inactivated derivatives [Kocuria rosea]
MRSTSPARYPSDLTDEQWALIEPMVPVKPGGRPAKYPRRRIVEAILYLDRTGCSWRSLPHDFPPWDLVYSYFKRWNAEGTTDRIHDALRAAVRDGAGRDPLASAGIVDAQSVKGADTVGAHSRGYDAGKKINGRQRHLVTDTLGMLMVVLVTTAALQDREGGRLVLDRARVATPSIVLVWANGGYAGMLVAFAT